MAAGCHGDNSPTGRIPYLDGDAVTAESLEPPTFPLDLLPGIEPHVVAAQDNVQFGNEAGMLSAAGATIEGSILHLDSTASDTAWGLWCWGAFGEGLLPRILELDTEPLDSGEFWLLLSNYHDNRWGSLGPLNDGQYKFSYWTGAEYMSPSGYTYAVVLVEGGNRLDVNQLNLRADEDLTPPAAPRNVNNYPPGATAITLYWTPNSEPDLYRYYVYQGPEPDFALDDPGVSYLGFAGAVEHEYGIADLLPETTYHFRITALDLTFNESLPSATVTATTADTALPPPPTDLIVVGFSSSWADLSWTAPEGTPPLGYEIFTGLSNGFQFGDAGVVKRHNGLVNGTSWRMTDLASTTQYYVGVRAYHSSKQSLISNTPVFTTTSSVPPVPAFSYDPLDVKSGLPVTFDPTATTDIDTPLPDLIFKWDYNNDGSIDRITIGPELVQHTYARRGPVTCKLSVSDGTYVSTTKDLNVGIHYEYFTGAEATGYAGHVVQVDTYPAHPRMAHLITYGDSAYVATYQEIGWLTLDASSIDADYLCDVALKPVGPSILAVDLDGTDLTWTVYGYGASTWTSSASQQVTADSLAMARLDISPAGRIAVVVVSGTADGPDVEYTLHSWHEQVGGSFSADNIALGTNTYEPVDVQRNDTTSRFIYCLAGSIHQWAFTDSSDSDQALQTYTGSVIDIATGVNPANDARVFWAVAASSERIYYGDNYGTANGSQWISLANPATAMLGVGLTTTGDNESLFYWTAEDGDTRQYLRGYDSTANGGSGAEYELASGMGAADGGAGAYVVIGSQPGVYTTCNETRDGECTGRFLAGGSLVSSHAVYSPQGDSDITAKHQTLFLTDGTLLCLSGQEFAVARGSFAVAPGQPFSFLNVGLDFWCYPDTACALAYAADYLVGSYTPDGRLVTTWFATDFPEDFEMGVFNGTALAQLAYNPYDGETILAYAADNATDLEVREWQGFAGWSDPVTIYTGAQQINALAVIGKPDFEWGIAFLDATDNLQLIESQTATWNPAVELSTAAVNNAAGIGLDYHSAGDLCVAVEREGAPAGVYLGNWPVDGSLVWELVSATAGDTATSVSAFYHLDNPLVLYYETAIPLADSRIQVVEKLAGIWNVTELAGEIHGAPVSIRRNTGGNIVLTGYSTQLSPAHVAIGILYR